MQVPVLPAPSLLYITLVYGVTQNLWPLSYGNSHLMEISQSIQVILGHTFFAKHLVWVAWPVIINSTITLCFQNKIAILVMSFLAAYETHHNNLTLHIKPLLLSFEEKFFFKSFHLIQKVNHLFKVYRRREVSLLMIADYSKWLLLFLRPNKKHVPAHLCLARLERLIGQSSHERKLQNWNLKQYWGCYLS